MRLSSGAGPSVQIRPVGTRDLKTIPLGASAPIFSYIEKEYHTFPTPRNFNYFWNFGAIATVMLVLMPGSGDAIQAIKAGVMEIADVFAVNKFDLPGGERIVQELKSALELSPPRPGGWRPPIHPTVAASGEGVEALFESLEAHHRHLVEHGLLEAHRLERARFEVESVIQEWGRQRTQGAGALVARVARGELTPEEAALALLGPGPEAEEGAL